jgi:hypothetical protein
MPIRTFQAGDEAVQADIYNEAAGDLPKFKPATAQEVGRRTAAADFDPAMRFFAEEAGRPVAYSLYNANGRVSYAWCRKGHEHLAGPLFQHVLNAMRGRGFRRAFAAYRGDWAGVGDFFTGHGFGRARDMVNFLVDVVDLPTIPARPAAAAGPLRPEDLPAVYELAPQALRVPGPAELGQHLLHNPYFGPESVFVLRARGGRAPVAAAVLVTDASYADPRALDANMPCFRLGAFGTEAMQAKRVKGLFSFLARADQNVSQLGADLLGQAALRLRDRDDVDAFAAQVPSDAPHLLQIYQRLFRRQGSFPVFERAL